jgi:hypothetical protein
MARHVVDDQWDDEAIGVAGLEKAYLLVDVFALRSAGGTDNDEAPRRRRALPLFGQTGNAPRQTHPGRGKSVGAHSECAPSGLAADKVIAELEALQLAVQPLGPAHIGVGVRNEPVVSQNGGVPQGSAPD